MALGRGARGGRPSAQAVPCSALELEVLPLSGTRMAVQDGTNLITFREQLWCQNERCGPRTTFPSLAVGMTTTYPEGASGLDVVEADVELNAVRFRFSNEQGPHLVLALAGEIATLPLHPVLVHELGHVVGLRDACGAHGPSGAPRFAECPERTKDSVMFAPALLGELTQRDRAFLCELYPRGTSPAGDDPVTQAPMSGGWWLGLAALVLVASYLLRDKLRR